MIRWHRTHTGRMTLGCAIAGAVALLAACSSPAPQAMRFAAAPWRDGETAVYTISADGSPAGSATFSVARETDDGGWILRRESSGPGGEEIAVVEVSESGFRPRTSTLLNLMPDSAEQVKATYDNGAVQLELTTRQNNVSYQKYSVPTDARDQRSLPFLVRALPLDKGYATALNTFLPYTGRLERVALQVEDRETIEVPAGSFDVWRVRMESPDRKSTAWIGVDAPHPLVRFKEGNLDLTLQTLD